MGNEVARRASVAIEVPAPNMALRVIVDAIPAHEPDEIHRDRLARLERKEHLGAVRALA